MPAHSTSSPLPLGGPVVWWAGASIVFMVVGAIGPWARALSFLAFSGLDGDGWFVLAAALISATALALHSTRSFASDWALVFIVIAGVVASTAAISALAQLLGVQSTELLGETDLAAPGWGLWLATLASVSLVLAASTAFVRGAGGQPGAAG